MWRVISISFLGNKTKGQGSLLYLFKCSLLINWYKKIKKKRERVKLASSTLTTPSWVTILFLVCNSFSILITKKENKIFRDAYCYIQFQNLLELSNVEKEKMATVREFHQHALLTALILRPSTHFGYFNSILSGCLWPWRLYFLGLNNWRDVFHTPKSDEYILVLCVALGHYEILACPLIPLL